MSLTYQDRVALQSSQPFIQQTTAALQVHAAGLLAAYHAAVQAGTAPTPAPGQALPANVLWAIRALTGQYTVGIAAYLVASGAIAAASPTDAEVQTAVDAAAPTFYSL